ncbi:molybdopterin-containing oxidoreductase family protein [Euzebya tangerina]|uniref:molybdopterin-containing oxidoreductase family protein n=1 Tax=Euzebya tangerina TaxID=591198 RepID=UPI000E314749|nr:molybdopterin dinucleotide binding domain-containing protein [Euzebya tangerina]
MREGRAHTGGADATRSYCRLCPALCGILVTTDGDRVVDVGGDPDHPLSEGYTCPKGRSLPQLHHRADRLEQPAIGRPAARVDVHWDDLLDDLADRLAGVEDTSGPDAVGMYVGTGSAFDGAGRATSRRFMRALGSRSYYSSGTVDSPCKPLVSELMAGSAAIMPHPTPSTRLTLLVGLNPVVSHGHLHAFPNPRKGLRTLREQGELWIVDPRRTASTALATHHLAPRPGTDHVWLAAVVREVLGSLDHAELRNRMTGLDQLVQAVEPIDLATAARICGVPTADLLRLVDAILAAGRIAVDSGTGLTMTAGANVAQWLLWTLAVITDSFDHPDGMWFNPGLLHSFDRITLIPTDGAPGPGPRSRPELPARVGELPAAAIAEEIESGHLRALLVYGGNLVTALPNAPRLRAALAQLEVLAVADVQPSVMTDLATHVLPVTGQLERPDLPWFDTLMPQISAQYTPAVVQPVGQRRHTWQVLAELGERLDLDVIGGLPVASATSDDVLRLMAKRSRVPFEELQSTAGPVIDPEVPYGWVRAVLPAGGWRVAPEPLVEQFAELTGRLLRREEGDGLMLAPSRRLRHLNSLLAGEATADGRTEKPEVLMHPDDLVGVGVAAGEAVEVTSEHGVVVGVAGVSDALQPGTVTMPHGFADVNVNDLTDDAEVDPLTGMPVYSGLQIHVTATGM